MSDPRGLDELTALLVPTEDPERDHGDADDVLIEAIRSLAQRIDNTEPVMDAASEAAERLIAAYEALVKWYA